MNKIKFIPTHTLIRLLDDSCIVKSDFKDYSCPYFKDDASRILWERFTDKDFKDYEKAVKAYNSHELLMDNEGVPEIPEQYYIDRFLLDTK